MKPIQSLADLKGLTDVVVEPLDIPEIGARVYVRAFDATAFAVFLAMYKTDGTFHMKDAAKIAALCMCDESGKRIADVDILAQELMTHSTTLVQTVFAKALDVSGLSVKAVEAAEKK